MLVLLSAQGRVSFNASWHRHAGAQPFCLWGWLCVSPGLVGTSTPALPCPAHTGAVARCLVWRVLQISAEQKPLGSGTLTQGLWSGGCVGSVMCSSLHCPPLLPRQSRRMGLPQAWESSCSWSLPCSVGTFWCSSLTPLPFTAQKCLQQIDTRAARVPSAKELKCGTGSMC